MKSCISEVFIFVVLCASLASCSNHSKRPSNSANPKIKKKSSCRDNLPKSTSHHSNSLHPDIHSESLPDEGSKHSLSEDTSLDFSIVNSLSPAGNSIGLSLGTESVVSHGPDKNFIQELSAIRAQQSGEPRYVRVCGFWKLEWSLGILSLSEYAASHSKPFIRSFSYFRKTKSFKMYFGSENFNNLLYFKYAAQAVKCFSDPESIFSENFKSKTIRKVFAVFSTFSSLHSHLLPFYYPFSFFYDTVFKSREHARVPFYFLFTTISYLLKNEHDKNAQYLKPLLKLAYRKALDGNRFKSDEWNFLKNFLSQYFDISDLNFKVKSKYGDIQFDISSVSFIYHEMRFGSSERVKSLFRQVWETSKQECNRRSNLLQISKSPDIFIPFKDDISANIFEREVRKLYQIEFTNLLFKIWNQIEDLLEEFAQLKFYFDNMIIDFRLRAFNANDFESLNNAMKHSFVASKGFL